jgi:hypothetical protein
MFCSGGTVMSGWLPIFDTLHGIRGEINLIIKVQGTLRGYIRSDSDCECGILCRFFKYGILILVITAISAAP